MSTLVVDRFDDWSQQSFSGGYQELQTLADREFSGVVRAGPAELYLTKGVVVGIRNGAVEDFEEGTGTVYTAPADPLPLLALMQERSDEVQAKYYTEKTSISEVDRTLSDGGFTGYIELSENVLSGDYYVAYHAGKSMSVAFVGESGKLIEGDEAFDTADDEVGIYEVRPVDIEPIEIPASTPASTGSAIADQGAKTSEDTFGGAGAGSDTSSPEIGRESSETGSGSSDILDDPDADWQPKQQTESEPADESPDRRERTANDSNSRTQEPVTNQSEPETESPQTTQQETETTESRIEDRDWRTESQSKKQADETSQQRRDSPGENRGGISGTVQESDAETASEPASSPSAQVSESSEQVREPDQPTPDLSNQREQTSGSQQGSQESSGIADTSLETRSIPSLDPERTEEPSRGDAENDPERSSSSADVAAPSGRSASSEPSSSQPSSPQSPSSEQTQQQTDTQTQQPQKERQSREQSQNRQRQPQATADEPTSTEPTDRKETVDPDRIESLESEIEDRDREIERLERQLNETTTERNELSEQLEAVRAERDELQGTVEQLEAQRKELETKLERLERLETEMGGTADRDRRMSPTEALQGTDIFIRYESKGDATLEKAHGGSTLREDVNNNLRLETHTQFDESTVSVNGMAYREFLESTIGYQFVEWVARDLLFEIRETNHIKQLKDLYNALPKIDRAELSGVLEITYTEDGQQTRTEKEFDVVIRDRMGNPLVVANINDSREGATQSMMEDIITSAERVGHSGPQFSGAFLVSKSFFEPGALETASEATKGGILSRDKRKSFVNLSRKQGYHLCLVEARNDNFHLAVPEL